MFAIIKHRMKIAVADDYAGLLLEARILARFSRRHTGCLAV